MNSSKVYKVEDKWFVDFIDANYELLPAVGIFSSKEEADKAAYEWNNTKNVENLG